METTEALYVMWHYSCAMAWQSISLCFRATHTHNVHASSVCWPELKQN